MMDGPVPPVPRAPCPRLLLRFMPASTGTSTPPDLSVALGRLRLANPILVASGTFGYGREMAGLVDLSRLGGIVPKTITKVARPGNAPWRTVETTGGMLNAIGDAELLGFIERTAKSSKLVGGICTGALILGAVGLLKGYTATTHWQTLDLLPLLGATPSKERVILDRNLITCGGVTAALDLGFELVRRYRGDFYAQGMQLLAEYDPKPPFPKGGNPSTADASVVTLLNQMHGSHVASWAQELQVALRSRKP